MLLSFGAKNFYSFREWAELSLEFGQQVPELVSKGERAAITLCLKGANASGKTNGLKILSFLSYFCTDSFGLKPDAEIPIRTFFGNADPAELYVAFLVDGIEYRYEVTLTDKAVISESIYRKKERFSEVLRREGDVIKVKTLFKQKKEIVVRNNASLISTAKQYEQPDIEAIYSFFDHIQTNVGMFGMHDRPPSYTAAAKIYHQEPGYLKFAKDFLCHFDTGVKDVKILKRMDEQEKEIYFPMFTHQTDQSLTFIEQSSGTQSLYLMLIKYKRALDKGGVLVFDEFDMNLHPDILPHLVSLFEDKETNPKRAQFVFTTHSNDVLDLMGKYKTYLFNKEEDESFCYRLDEIPGGLIRNDRPIAPLYKAGKIGGVPRLRVQK